MLRFLKILPSQLTLVWLFLLPIQAHAENIDFLDFKLVGTPEKFEITTRVEFVLTDYLRSALQNGVTLNARIQFRLGKHNSWWFNEDTSLLTATYQLKYHALSRHYLLSRSDTNEHWNFSTLPSAIRKLSELRKYTLPDISASLEDGEYYILAAADMIPSSLGLPLRIQSLFSDEYKLTSEGVLWPLP